ncbi:hypothetical protein ABW19_dt0205420 [Dactylella cylindrospora]|nr:hypothetical protein ABW19_dt0205420 [Dactylella cylindrospora]
MSSSGKAAGVEVDADTKSGPSIKGSDVPTAGSSNQSNMDNQRSDVKDAVDQIKQIAKERLRQQASTTAKEVDEKDEAHPQEPAATSKQAPAPLKSLSAPVKQRPSESDPNPDADGLAAAVAKLRIDNAAREAEAVKVDGSKKVKQTEATLSSASVSNKKAANQQTRPEAAKTVATPMSAQEFKPPEPKLPQTEDGFEPRPWVKRRYTIAQLLLLGEILPYIICPRDRFDIQTFSYDIVHIPGLGCESTGNPVVDHQILTLNLRTELIAFQYFSAFHYRYLDRFKSPDHTLFVKGLWVEVRGSAGLRDHGGYRNAYRPKPYDFCVKEGLINENQEAEAMNQPILKENDIPGVNLSNIDSAANVGPPTPIVGNDIAHAVSLDTGTLHDISKKYAEVQLVRSEIEQAVANIGDFGGDSTSHLVEEAKEKLAEKKAEITNKWGGVYGYALQDQDGTTVKKPKGLSGCV